jgi:hypothetical protein
MRLITRSWIIDVYGACYKETAEARDMLLVVDIVPGRFHLDLWQVLPEGKNDSTLLISDAPAVSFTLGGSRFGLLEGILVAIPNLSTLQVTLIV